MTVDFAMALVLLFVMPACYLAPYLIGRARGIDNQRDLLVFNLIAGFTFLGWLYALGWALTAARSYRWVPLPPAAAPAPIMEFPLVQDWRMRRILGMDSLRADDRWPTSKSGG